MTTQASIPAKWYVPFAEGDVNRVEIPPTTPDPTRASQTLGFPPLTMQPPESGGVPPQGEDFNGAMNQIARVCWWTLNGGGWPYDAAFASDANINGYPNGAKLQSADFRGDWISLADGNTSNPDTGTGTSWVPGFQYGVTTLSGLTGGTVTPTPAQAAKRRITLSGTLTSTLTVELPAWLKDWDITNSTTGAFVTIVKTAAGSGVTIPQNGAPTRVTGDGTNIVQVAENGAVATTSTQAPQFGQVTGIVGQARNVAATIAVASASGTWTADEIVVKTALGGLPYVLGTFSQAINLATTGAGGMDTGTAPVSGYVAVYAIYNPTTNTRALLGFNATSVTATETYTGANAPAGFTASALISVWRTNASSQFIAGNQQGRTVNFSGVSVLSGGTATTATSFSIAGAAPRNAKTVIPNMSCTAGSAGNGYFLSPESTASIGIRAIANPVTTAIMAITVAPLPVLTVQTLWYVNNAATSQAFLAITGYDF